MYFKSLFNLGNSIVQNFKFVRFSKKLPYSNLMMRKPYM